MISCAQDFNHTAKGLLIVEKTSAKIGSLLGSPNSRHNSIYWVTFRVISASSPQPNNNALLPSAISCLVCLYQPVGTKRVGTKCEIELVCLYQPAGMKRFGTKREIELVWLYQLVGNQPES